RSALRFPLGSIEMRGLSRLRALAIQYLKNLQRAKRSILDARLDLVPRASTWLGSLVGASVSKCARKRCFETHLVQIEWEPTVMALAEVSEAHLLRTPAKN